MAARMVPNAVGSRQHPAVADQGPAAPVHKFDQPGELVPARGPAAVDSVVVAALSVAVDLLLGVGCVLLGGSLVVLVSPAAVAAARREPICELVKLQIPDGLRKSELRLTLFNNLQVF